MPKPINERRAAKNKLILENKNKSNDATIIVWSFARVDRNGEFAFDINRDDFDVGEFLEKLMEFSTMKWFELFPRDERKSRHHPLSKDSLSKKAEERIKFMHLENDSDSIYSLALGGKKRLIGIRDGAVFQIIWYDANHEFVPGNKK